MAASFINRPEQAWHTGEQSLDDTPSSNCPSELRRDTCIATEDSFRRSISLERKRTERSHRSFLLVLLDLELMLREPGGEQALRQILGVLSTSIRETDVMGWYKKHAILGVMFTEVATDARAAIVGAILSRLNGLLYSKL